MGFKRVRHITVSIMHSRYLVSTARSSESTCSLPSSLLFHSSSSQTTFIDNITVFPVKF
jgi:hypothetical protein